MMERVLWVHHSRPKCAICRSYLDEYCMNCEYGKNQDPDVIWLTMLMMQRRKGTFCICLDRAVLAKIYGFVEHVWKGCSIVHLHCNHAFHRHCIVRWLVKRDFCPLCNSVDTSFIEPQSQTESCLVLSSVYQSARPRKEHQFKVNTFLYNAVKHKHNGICRDEQLFDMFLRKIFLIRV